MCISYIYIDICIYVHVHVVYMHVHIYLSCVRLRQHGNLNVILSIRIDDGSGEVCRVATCEELKPSQCVVRRRAALLNFRSKLL